MALGKDPMGACFCPRCRPTQPLAVSGPATRAANAEPFAPDAAPTLVQDSRRPVVEKEFFVRHPRLGWMLQPNLVYDLIDSASQRRVPYFTTGADPARQRRTP